MPLKPNWKSSKLWIIAGSIFLLLSFLILSDKGNTYQLPKTVDFNYDIRPILSDNCFICHGPDSSSRQANLRLDTEADATALLSSGKRAIVPHRPAKSSLLDRVSSRDPSFQMPPPEMNKTLSDREVALLRKWIKQGAKWEPYWAFISPQKPSLPAKIAKQEPSRIIDYLLTQKLKSKKLKPAPQAGKNELIRRVSYLLTGLPPSPEVVEAYLADTSPDAYEQMLDQYLNSPHFGERWARHWMDLVRYGEHMGHEFDFSISGAWRYRDYLIRAFNEDVPYDQFVKEHLAGDLLAEPRAHPEEGFNESIIGTAYLFLGEGKHSPVSLKGEEVDRIDNMIDVTSKTFQGLTVACARCHDHKFDPIPTTDYYAMYGMLESARLGPVPARMKIQNQAILDELEDIKRALKSEIESVITTQSAAETAAQKVFIQSLTQKQLDAKFLDPSIKKIGDFREGNWATWYTNGLAFGNAPIVGKAIYSEEKDRVLGFEEAHASSQTYGTGVQGVLHSPNFTIEKDYVAVKARGEKSIIRIIVENFQVIQYPLWGGFERRVNEEEWQTYTFDLSMVKGHKAYIAFLPGYYEQHAYQLAPESYIDVQYAYAYDSLFVEPDLPLDVEGLNADNELINRWKQDKVSAPEVAYLNFIWDKDFKNKTFPKVPDILQRFDSLSRQLHDPAHVIGAADGDAVFSPVFIRGNKDQLSKEKVPRSFLTALSQDEHFSQQGSGRLAWAEAVVDPANPLSSRVMVNRIWHHIFGSGIVESVDNFGLQGKLPSHPELLDYLSIYFIEEGWSIKKVIKQILLSKTFQQSTVSIVSNEAIDPDNRFLHYFPIRRLEAEAIRDAMLATSGELNPKMYGEPVPIHLTEFMTGRGRPGKSGPLDGNGRRSVYLAIRRNFIAPMMSVFDTPVPFSTFGKRNTTNVPAQSLTLMNDPFVHEQASKWADKLLKDLDRTPEARIQEIYLRAFAREATAEEIEDALKYINSLEQQYTGDVDQMSSEHQIWTDYCHTIFNLKEFIHLR